MKAKRLIALALAAVFMLSAAATPVFATAALPQENAALEQQNDMVSIRLKATGTGAKSRIMIFLSLYQGQSVDMMFLIQILIIG